MNRRQISKKSIQFLKNFIDDNEELISYLINPRGYIKQSIGGAPYTLKNLQKCNYIKYNKNKEHCVLTQKGKNVVKEIILKNKFKNQKWDKKWRILIFDIPERKRRFRDNLRKTLIGIGFCQLQKSVWIFPYDVINYLYDIVPGFREGDWFEYVEADKISSQDKMKERFGLK